MKVVLLVALFFLDGILHFFIGAKVGMEIEKQKEREAATQYLNTVLADAKTKLNEILKKKEKEKEE